MESSATAKKGSIVLYPSPGIGHLEPLLEFAKILVGRGLPVTIAMLDPSYISGYAAAFIDRVAKAHPNILFHRLPALIRLSNANLHRYLASSSPIAVVLDFFCATALDVVTELGIPAFFFFTSCAGALAAFIHLPVIDKATTESFQNLGDTLIQFPCLPPIPASHMAAPLLDRRHDSYTGFINLATRIIDGDGIIVNTFEALEPAALVAIRSGLYLPEGVRTPPIYCVGPLIASEDQERGARAECLSWLHSQPPASVVFLSFGSLGLFSEDQLREIANGLETSGQRFLWVVRNPPTKEESTIDEKQREPNLHSLLPAGFLERTRRRGMVVKSWVPQVSVLAHESVGGFVTHLGWNSVLEAICAGVPMVGWPLYAEQRMNKVFLADGLGLVGVMEGYDKGLVLAAEVDARIRWLMESEGGSALRMETSVAKEAAAAAMKNSGSSQRALEEFERALSIPRLQ
ncbi:unnamed protein product [Spirodela intermedia]|uniref:Uncharacterized protein n=1 Tax=Spirodela intermedia TaxID=51605 RepID=A0A7I8J6T2_SPIIN|nr:unnamed protein product [Spirodela intermedia]CAA6665947.1 unnamed protein product [Spirodela intermedia]